MAFTHLPWQSSYTTPVLHVNIPGFEARLENWTSALGGHALVSMGTDFYNEVPSAWVRSSLSLSQSVALFMCCA